MDLFRKSGYKVEPKPILEKKRRKSELVVMWQSIWDVTITTLLEFYLNVLGLWEALKFYFNSNEQQKVRKWLIEYLPRVPNDFSESWRDGILLSILLNKLQPGCCPGAEYLDANYALRNLYHVFQLLEYHFNITPKCTVEEIITCSNGSDSKLLELLLQLKNETDTKTDEIYPLLNTKENEEDESGDCSTSTNCVARGTGLMVGFVGRAANFIVFFASISDLDLVVEIKGPCETVCSERITKRSPKKKEVLKPWIPTSPHHMTRSSSNEDRSKFPIQQASKSEKDGTRYIPLEYEVHSNRICFAYMPLMKGQHQIKILSRGMHVSDSPYNVAVAPVGDSHKSSPIRSLKSSLKVENSFDCREPSKATVRFQDTSERKERLGNIIKRRVLRYIVKIDNKDVVVDTDSIDNLATSLLKMDYDFQKPPLNRRNSWGFVGDAERKVSVIRQFCVNMDELEAQSVKLHRSQSISAGSGSNKISFSRRDSCEDIPPSPQKKLETVKEGTVSHFDSEALRHSKTEEESLVYMNEDFDTNMESIEIEEECDIVTDKQIYKTELAGDSIENVSKIAMQTYVGTEEKLFQQRIAHTTSDSLNDESETFTQMGSIRKPLDLLPSAREISSRLDDEAEEQSTTMSNFDKIDHIIFPDLQSTENEGDIKRETIPSCYQIDFTSFTEGTISTEKYENSNIPKINRFLPKAELSQNEYPNSPENNFSDEVFIEEVLCTKTDVRNANQTFQNNREISNRHCAIETSMISEKPVKNSEGVVHLGKCEEHSLRNKTQTLNANETLKIQHKSKHSRRWYCKMNNPNRKSNKKRIDENQRYMNSKLYSKPFEDLNQNTNIFSNMEEYNEIRLKPARNIKINNVSPSSHRKRILTNNSKEASSIHTLKDSYTQTYVSCNQKKYRENPFFTNNLKDESKLIPKLQAKKINIEFSNNNFKEKSITQVPSFTQISEPNSESNSIQDSPSRTTSTSLTLCQLNFRHFNPTLPNQRISLVKDRISQWEENVGKENLSPKYKHSSRIVSKSDITSRLNFWETVTKENKLEEKHGRASESSKSMEENATNTRPNTLTPSATFNKKLDEEFVTFRKTRRSASYPGTVKTSIQNSLYTIQRELEADLSVKELATEPNASSPESMSQQAHQTSSAEYPSSASIFDNSSDDEDDSADLLDSTEDEYIDDEISESAASAYWGDISVMEHLKSADSNEYRDICRIVDGELWGQNEDDCASECQVFGIATYFGYVAVKNRFQVLTKGTGSGNLSATLQGFGRHDVSLVCVRYLQRDLYEVTYQVMSPGLYLISVRWMERPIAGSPFLCKVTF